MSISTPRRKLSCKTPSETFYRPSFFSLLPLFLSCPCPVAKLCNNKRFDLTLISRARCLSPRLSGVQMLPASHDLCILRDVIWWLRSAGRGPDQADLSLTHAPLPGYRLVQYDWKDSSVYWQNRWGVGSEGMLHQEALGRPQDACVRHAYVPGKCWREVLMERALLWVCSNPNARRLHSCYLWESQAAAEQWFSREWFYLPSDQIFFH